MRVAYRSQIPLIGRSPVDAQLANPRSPLGRAIAGTLTPSLARSAITEANRQTRSIAIIKPGRRLGGGWIDQLVSERKSVTLCPDCQRKYGNWYTKVNYEPRLQRELSDCDGCGTELSFCVGFYFHDLRPN